MSKLKVLKIGKGPDLALLHGWGSSSKIWKTCAKELSQKFRIWCIDLPGHGDSHDIKWGASTEHGMKLLAQSLPQKCSIIGWSLGGLAAQLYTTHFPQRVEKLMLIASAPRFTKNQQWPYGMSENIFNNFTTQFENAPSQTLKKFNMLQILNSKFSRKTLSLLNESLSNKEKNLKNIYWGLQWLNDIDLREDRTLKKCPITLLHGENDQVLSFKAAKQTKQIWEHTDLIKIADAGHAPFISHTQLFLKYIERWS